MLPFVFSFPVLSPFDHNVVTTWCVMYLLAVNLLKNYLLKSLAQSRWSSLLLFQMHKTVTVVKNTFITINVCYTVFSASNLWWCFFCILSGIQFKFQQNFENHHAFLFAWHFLQKKNVCKSLNCWNPMKFLLEILRRILFGRLDNKNTWKVKPTIDSRPCA